jgi:hypothetical protein
VASPLFPSFNNKRKQDQIAAEIQAKAGSAGKTTGGLRQWLSKQISTAGEKSLGATGQLLAALFKPFSKQSSSLSRAEIEAAQQLMNELELPQAAGNSGLNIPSARPHYQVRTNQPPDDDDYRLGHRNTEPVMEGPILVNGSSNVFSIAFLFPTNGDTSGTGAIVVRFLAGDSKHRAGPGASYKYWPVSYSLFTEFKHAASAGKFVWDNFRIRHTVSGHQTNVAIIDIGDLPAVPRLAGLKRGLQGEFFIPRTLNGQRSSLPERKVRSGGRSNIPGWENRSNLKLRQTGRR